MLCTSYAQVRDLHRHLVSLGIGEHRIVANSGRLIDDQKEYVRLHSIGAHPIWLILGPGWVGVDLREDGKSAEDDTLLTDLVITRIPLGLNRSLTMQTRIDYSHFRAIAQEAMLKFKQGIGRIIRRAGLKHRRIWILDGRLPLKPSSRFMAEVNAGVFLLLEKYKTRKRFGA